MQRVLFAVVLSVLAVSATAQSPADQAEKALQNYTRTGERQTCIPLRQIRNTQILDNARILFFTLDGSVYLNELPQPCVSLNPHRAFKYETTLPRLCNTDIITVFQPGPPAMELGSCGLGQFERLKKRSP